MMQTLYILTGISSSGKSFYAKELAARTGALIVSTDELRERLFGDVADQSKNGYLFGVVVPLRIEAALRDGESVIFDATSLTVKDRKHILSFASGARTECHYIEPDLKKALAYQEQRERKVPLSVMERQIRKYVKPSLSEGFDLIQNIGML